MASRKESKAAQPFIEAQRLAASGRWNEAGDRYKRCIETDAEFLPAWFALGQLQSMQGNHASAHGILGQAMRLAAGDASATRLVAPALARILSMLTPHTYDERLEAELIVCLGEPQVDAQQLSNIIARILLLKHPRADADLDSIGQDPLWMALLTRCTNTDPEIERRLAICRRRALQSHVKEAVIPHRRLRSIQAIALQAFSGEYVWPIAQEERDLLGSVIQPTIAALYQPLIDLGQSFKSMKKDRISSLLVKRTYNDLAEEAELAAGFPTINPVVVNDVSAAVRAQYEEHPYPRWQTPPVPRPSDLRKTIAALSAIDLDILPDAPLDVLIAGCGTGYETIGVARTDASVSITALDLSRKSLAYGRRMAAELNAPEIKFLQGDILNLSQSAERYDVIFSTGVLHHMERPADGLAALDHVLKGGGMIRLGLYSAHARSPIRDARALIQKMGWLSDPNGIRAFRDYVLNLPADAPMASLRNSPDFFSMSGCRDLAFHVQEHQYTLPEISGLLQHAKLRLVGIEPPAGAQALFDATYGTGVDRLDLERWDNLERQHPSLFAEMYIVWCQKPG